MSPSASSRVLFPEPDAPTTNVSSPEQMFNSWTISAGVPGAYSHVKLLTSIILKRLDVIERQENQKMAPNKRVLQFPTLVTIRIQFVRELRKKSDAFSLNWSIDFAHSLLSLFE